MIAAEGRTAMHRRTMLGAALPLAISRRARAAAPEIRFARQFSMGYLQFNVMERQRLIQKHAAALGLPEVNVSWITFNGPDAMNGALISDTVDIVSGGIPGLLTLWSRTHGTAQEVRGIAALSSQPCLLNTRNPALRTIADLGPDDRVAVPTVKVSIQAVTLQMEAARLFGAAEFARFDPLTVSMSPPDATIALLGGGAGITCAFSVPPFQEQQLEKPGIRTLLNSFDVAGPHSFTLAWTTARFRSRNPVLYQALVLALTEATAIVNADRTAAAQLWIEDTKSKLPIEKVARVVAGPQVNWTMTPEGTMRYARFMQTAGTLRAVPGAWSDLFFPEAQGLNGS
jgi:NitT/TauT family transport system substrate-binding protein